MHNKNARNLNETVRVGPIDGTFMKRHDKTRQSTKIEDSKLRTQNFVFLINPIHIYLGNSRESI